MFTIRSEQLAELARQTKGSNFVEELTRLGYRAALDGKSNDVVAADSNGNTTRFRLDSYGRVSHFTTPLGRRYSFDYTTDDRLAMLLEPTGLESKFEYDNRGLLRTLSRGRDRTWSFDWDQWGNVRQVTHPDKTTTQVTNLGLGRPVAFKDRSGNTSLFERNETGAIVAIVDPKGNRTEFDYQQWDRPSRIRRPNGSSEEIRRNERGQVASASINGQLWAQIEYGPADRVKEIRYSDGHFVAFVFNDAGNVTEAKNPSCTVKRQYDDHQRLVQEDQGGQVVSYTYDAGGLLASIATPDGESLKFAYDGEARLTSVEDWNGGQHLFKYEASGRAIEQHFPNGVGVRTLLTELGSPAEIGALGAHLPDQRLFLRFDYNLDDRVVTLQDSEAGIKKISYGPDGFVLGVESSSGRESFSYDANGNRTGLGSEAAQFDVMNQMTQQGSEAMTYDSRGNLIEKSGPGGTTRYTYNGQNLLVRVDLPNGQRIEFAYDAFARRIFKTVGSARTRYVWAGDQLLGEFTEGESPPDRRDYLFVPGSHVPLSMRANGKIYQYHTDHTGTPRWLTNEFGRLVWSADCSASGWTVLLKQGPKQPLRFAGQYHDEETNLHYNRARYYSPDLGRYLSRDPLETVAGLNFYTYAENDSINGSDPLGLGFWKALLVTAAVVAGAALIIVAAPIVAAAVVAVATGAAVAAGTAAAAAAVVGGAALVGAGIGLGLAPDDASPGSQALAALKGGAMGAGAALAVMGAAFTAAGLVAGCGGAGLVAAGAGGGQFVVPTVVSSTAVNAVGAGVTGAAVGTVLMSQANKSGGGSKPSNKDDAKYTSKSDKHVADHGHADDGQPKMVDKAATKQAGQTQYKSKFGSGEGGQQFTDEVVDHPNTVKTTQSNGRIRYTNNDLGRGATGTGRDGAPVKGGEVIVEGANPKSGSNTGDVVTQYPAGSPGP